MSLKSKITNAISSHPKIVTFGIGLTIAYAIVTIIGMVDDGQAFAFQNQENTGSNALSPQ